ncbi:MAG TPA: mechanosensitive ion channel domain-containing protein [Burkholderiales bacterium]|nr:mechanosensitive ion channel domain-containing protein [Burkholderiales bacterium]
MPWPLRVLVALLALFCPLSSLAVGATSGESALQSAPLIVANRTIIVLRGPIAGYTAEERAANSMQRIDEALESDPNPAISFADHETATRVLLGGKHMFLVTRLDIDEQAGETTQLVAEEAGKRLSMAIGERREQRSFRYLAIATSIAAAATLIYGLAVWLLYRGSRRLGRRASMAAQSRARKLHIGNVYSVTKRLIALVAWVIAVVMTSAWIAFVLKRFPYTRAWGEHLAGNLIDIVERVALAISNAVPGLLLVAIIILLARTLIGIAKVFFDRVEAGNIRVAWLDADTIRPTRRIFAIVVWIFALAMAYPYLPGAHTDAFKGLSVLIGVMISLGGASIIGQAFSGLSLMYMRAFRKGDYVRIGDTEGTVMELGMFATRIRTGLGEEVTLPNATIMTQTTRNYSRAVPGTGYIVDTVVTIGYSTPWRQVHAMLEEAAARTADIAKTPPPFVRQTSLSDYYVEYRLIAYTPLEKPVPRADVLNRLHGQIQDVFNEYGVQIMSPHYMMDPESPQVVPKENWHAPPAKPPGQS